MNPFEVISMLDQEFREKKKGSKSLSTLYRLPSFKESSVDPDLYPLSYGGKTIPRCPPGLENLYNIDKVYLTKELQMLQDDVFNDYKGELIDEKGDRIFVITTAAHYMSNEVVHYGKYKTIKIKGKVNYGALNHEGIQLFEIYGDPEKVIRIGPNSALWGEIQVIPGHVWNRVQNCCCIRIGHQNADTEIRVVVLKKDNRARIANELIGEVFKQVYTLRGKISGGCNSQNQRNFLYKKTFELNLYHHDPFALDESEEDDEEDEKKKLEKKSKRDEPIGRLCSQSLHEKLDLHLPILEFPPNISVYDKLTLMGAFFLFTLKI